MCLEYSNSSFSCKQMCVCVTAHVCICTLPRDLGLLRTMLQSKERRLWHAFTIYQINGMPSCGLSLPLRQSRVVFHWNNSRSNKQTIVAAASAGTPKVRIND